MRALRVTAISLLNAYVGHKAGERILAGRIRRGDVEAIHAVIWLSDMRGFTRRADTMPPASLIELLNLFYDNLVPPIEAEGGEVLKFMGDGLLAIFRIDDDADADAACGRALRAAKAAQANIAALPSAGASGWSSRCASGSPCMSAKRSTAISARARGSTSPASAPPSIAPRGWKRSPRG